MTNLSYPNMVVSPRLDKSMSAITAFGPREARIEADLENQGELLERRLHPQNSLGVVAHRGEPIQLPRIS